MTSDTHLELNRFIHAAVCSHQMAEELLKTPRQAVQQYGHALTPLERDLVLAVHGAQDIHDFALRLHTKVEVARLTGRVIKDRLPQPIS